MVLPAWLKRLLLSRRYRAERAALRQGLPPASPSAGESVVYFTVHKCASTFVPRYLRYVNTRHLGLRPLDLAGYLWHYEGDRVYDVLEDRSGEIFSPRGFLYAPLRQAVRIPAPDRYRMLLMLRDPRDLLVSHYYSIRYSHKQPAQDKKRAEFLGRRVAAGDASVDDYVREMAPVFRKRYRDYLNIVVGEYGVEPLRYEDMVADCRGWVRAFFSRLDLAPDEKDYQAAADIGGFERAVRGDIHDHVRRREPGEFRERLRPDTVDWLGEYFAPELAQLGYADDGDDAPAERLPTSSIIG